MRSDSALTALMAQVYSGAEVIISEAEHDRLIDLFTDDDRFSECATLWNPKRCGILDALILWRKNPGFYESRKNDPT